VVLWRDVPRVGALDAAVARGAGAAVEAVYAAGGRDHEEGAVDWARAAAGLDAVVVVAEAWEAPDQGALRLLRRLREALGPRRRLVVLLADVSDGAVRAPSAGEVRTWRDGLAPLGDPWLAVVAAPEDA
jgi:hypothetical protein